MKRCYQFSCYSNKFHRSEGYFTFIFVKDFLFIVRISYEVLVDYHPLTWFYLHFGRRFALLLGFLSTRKDSFCNHWHANIIHEWGIISTIYKSTVCKCWQLWSAIYSLCVCDCSYASSQLELHQYHINNSALTTYCAQFY